MRPRMFVTVALVAVLLASLAMFRVTAQQTPSSDDYSFVWFANAGSDGPAVDIYFGDGSGEPLVADLEFGKTSDMFVIPSNQRGFVMREAGSETTSDPIFTGAWGLTPNQSYLVMATGLAAKKAFILEPVTLVRNNTQGKARLRIINAVSGGPALEIVDGKGTTLAQNMQYLSVADADVEPGAYELTVRTAGGETRATQNVALEADMINVVVIAGGPEGTPVTRLVVLEVPQETTRVKIVNNADANFDVTVNDNESEEPIAVNLAPGANTEWFELPSGAAGFIVRDADAVSDAPQLAALSVQLRPSRDVTLTIQGSGDQIQLVVTNEVLMGGLTVAAQGQPIESAPPPVATATQVAPSAPQATTEPPSTVEATAEPTTEPTPEMTPEPTLEPTAESTPAS